MKCQNQPEDDTLENLKAMAQNTTKVKQFFSLTLYSTQAPLDAFKM